jgi:hypothetical protein
MASSLLLEILRTDPPDWTRAWQVMENHRLAADRADVLDAGRTASTATAADSLEEPSLADHVDEHGRSLLHHAVAAAIHQKHQLGSQPGGSSRCEDMTAASVCEMDQDEKQNQELEQNQINHRQSLILSLLEQNPEATARQTLNGKYTPLHCAVQSVHLDCLERDSKIVKMLLKTNPAAALLKTNDRNHHRRLTPLSLHIVAVSSLMMIEEEQRNDMATNLNNDETLAPKRLSKALLQALLPYCTLPQLEEAVEVLYDCNSTLVLSTWIEQERHSHKNRLLYGRQTRAVQIDDSCWVWDWAMTLFKAVHVKHQQQRHFSDNTLSTTIAHQQAPFRALHTAARITDCPIPFLLMALRSHPTQVRLPNTTDNGNLPLHTVAKWSYNTESCFSSSTCRKSMALTELVVAHRKALVAKNALGLTPMQLEAESGVVIE